MSITPVISDDTFQAMGTDIELLLFHETGGRDAGGLAIARLLAAEWEATFSRFRADTDLSLLNSRAGKPALVTARLYAAVEAALEACQRTGGLFNPLILPRLAALGYDRTFREVAGSGDVDVPVEPAPDASLVRLDPDRSTITLPAGTAIDLGGIAKGLYADALAGKLSACPAGLVSAGGDMRVWGRLPGGRPWMIGLEDPAARERDLVEIHLRDGAIATSGTNRRRWRRGSGTAHHLIDPRTGMPAATRAGSVTVVADTAASADALATALFVGGMARPVLASLLPHFALAIAARPDGTIETIQGVLEIDVSINQPGYR